MAGAQGLELSSDSSQYIYISRKLGFGELSLNTETWDGGIPNGNLNTAKYQLLECRLEDMILQLDQDDSENPITDAT